MYTYYKHSYKVCVEYFVQGSKNKMVTVLRFQVISDNLLHTECVTILSPIQITQEENNSSNSNSSSKKQQQKSILI